jgi:hypothetical protein
MFHMTGHVWVWKNFENVEGMMYNSLSFYGFHTFQFSLIQFNLFS